MSKRCSTPLPCKFENHCVHRQIPMNLCSGFFWPNGTGESCQQYELHTPTPEELAERMSRLAGSHE